MSSIGEDGYSVPQLAPPEGLLRPQGRVRIGVVGPDDLVERVLLLPSLGNEPLARLVPMPYRDESQIPEILSSTTGGLDAYLFTGPVPYDLAVAADVLPAPGTYIPLSGAALYAALIRGIMAGDFRPERVSIDTLVERDVEEAYAELGLSAAELRLYSHAPGHHLDDIVAFHSNAVESLGATAALTGLRSAHEEMLRRGLASYRILPTSQSIRSALRTAILMATGARLGDAQVAMSVVALGTTERPELNLLEEGRAAAVLAAQRALMAEARAIGALVLPVGPSLFLVAGTVKSFETATDGYRRCPFYGSLSEASGEPVSVGVGLADTALAAHRAAWEAVRACQASGGGHGRLIQADGSVMVLPGVRGSKSVRDRPRLGRLEYRYLVELAERYGALAKSEADSHDPVVSAEEVADLLEISPRSGRRLLNSLSDADLAWPLPPERGPNRGRPKHRWRLLLNAISAMLSDETSAQGDV